MATYYVGSGGNDGNSGATWALRKLTLNGAEDIPVAAGDTVYVGPGVYRELLTCDVSGSVGSPITYIGDVTGENTDGVGGVVRITGSDNDTTTTRNNCISSGQDYRTFRGFAMDLTSAPIISFDTSGDNNIIEDCSFQHCTDANGMIYINGANQEDNIIRQCIFRDGAYGIRFRHTSTVASTNQLIENCIFMFLEDDCILVDDIDDITIKNCLFNGIGDDAVDVLDSTGNTQVTINNCILMGCNGSALEGVATTDIIEDYNTFYNNNADRTNTNTGANSQTYPPLFLPPILFDGIKMPWDTFALSEWSAVNAIAGTGESTDDLYGITRPTTSAKKSWGPIQFHDMERETGTTRGGSTASIVFHDAGRHQIFVPVTNTSTDFSVYVYREANYAGTNPQMIIKQPGQSDDTTTDAGGTGAWNELTSTLTPSADTDFVVVELVSNNTAAAGSYEVFFDDLTVS
jgi:hypothetical protein